MLKMTTNDAVARIATRTKIFAAPCHGRRQMLFGSSLNNRFRLSTTFSPSAGCAGRAAGLLWAGQQRAIRVRSTSSANNQFLLSQDHQRFRGGEAAFSSRVTTDVESRDTSCRTNQYHPHCGQPAHAWRQGQISSRHTRQRYPPWSRARADARCVGALKWQLVRLAAFSARQAAGTWRGGWRDEGGGFRIDLPWFI